MTYISTKLKKEITITEIITIHYFEYMKNITFSGESHDFWELLYVDKGCVCVQAGDNQYQLCSGDIIFHQPNEFHAFKAQGKIAPNLVAISFLTASPAINFYRNRSFTLTLEERTIISKIIHEARHAFSTPLHVPSVEQVLPSDNAPFGSEQLIQLYLELFLILAKRNHTTSNSANLIHHPTPMELSIHSKRVESIIEYMNLHIREKLTIQDICEEFSISRSCLHSLFYKEKHCGAMDYFNHLKLNYAKEMMRHSTMNLTEIAHSLSYSSLQYFSKQFKKSTGMSPLEYSSSIKGISQSFYFH